MWDCHEIETSLMSFGITPQQSNLMAIGGENGTGDFNLVECRWCASLLRDVNSIGGLEGGDQLKGDWIKIKLRNANGGNFVSLNLINMRLIDSPLNNR